MSRIEQAMYCIMKTFNDYTGKEGNYVTLTKKDFIKLLHTEFPEAEKSSEEVNSLFQKLDADSDGVITFEEFVAIIAEIHMLCRKK